MNEDMLDESAIRRFRHEGTVTEGLNHANIVKILQKGEYTIKEAGELKDKLYIAMEYLDGQTLDQKMKDQQKTKEQLINELVALKTECQRMQETLRKSEAQWRSVARDLPDHVLTLDRDLIIQYANFASPGLTVEEVVGRAVKYATKRDAVLTRTILVRAALDLAEETEEQPRKQLLVTLLKQMERDWFGVFPPSGLLD